MGRTAQGKTNSNPPRESRWLMRLAIGSLVALVPSWLIADWWTVIPSDVSATYVGRASCVECHQSEYQQWQGSHHDLAMDSATADTVLGDFNDAQLEHFGTLSRMFRRGDDFIVNTEGPNGQLRDFRIKYVFGVEPLQQYLVEFDRPAEMVENENARLQVLRITWDTERNRWFYLSPPDVDEKLAPDDPLHWTGSAQNWNHMCAECHSTNLQKNFDVATKTYHTTFTDIDVSCEACHGPGSLHVQQAKSRSVFWDRKRGYALKRLKSANSRPEIEACAPCHSRRSVIADCNAAQADYYDCCENELLRPLTYYPDGQIRDEVYVYGSFVQSKMYHKGIRCSDCHDSHSAQLIRDGNQVCTSCHQHPAAKYDTPAHHNHRQGSTGASCVECHMPETPFMEVDFRRDHSLRVPRPDLSVRWQTPNACTGCHLEKTKLPAEKASGLGCYADWLAAATSDEQIRTEISRVDEWASEWVRKWYGDKPRPHFANALGAAWQGDPQSTERLKEVVQSREAAEITRASALWQLFLQAPEASVPLAKRLISNRSPQIRATAIRCLQAADVATIIETAGARLNDPVRLVRIEAANLLSGVPRDRLTRDQQLALTPALEEYRSAMLRNSDQGGSHLALGVLAERMGDFQRARSAYETAIHVQPKVAGPRSNLAQLLQNMGDTKLSQRLLSEELLLLQRDAKLAPEHPSVQYRYGLSLYLNGRLDDALPLIHRAHELQPANTEYLLMLCLLNEKLRNWQASLESLEQLIALQPGNPELLPIRQRLLARIRAAGS